MNEDITDRTLSFRVRTTAIGARQLSKALSDWIGDESVNYRRIDMFEQRVDGIPMEKNNDNTKELSRTSCGSAAGGG